MSASSFFDPSDPLGLQRHRRVGHPASYAPVTAAFDQLMSRIRSPIFPLPDILDLLNNPEVQAQINLQDNCGNTPLNLACKHSRGQLQLVQALLEKGAGASINLSDHILRTPIAWACVNRDFELIKLLTAQPNFLPECLAQPDDHHELPLGLLLRNQTPLAPPPSELEQMLTHLVSAGADVSQKRRYGSLEQNVRYLFGEEKLLALKDIPRQKERWNEVSPWLHALVHYAASRTPADETDAAAAKKPNTTPEGISPEVATLLTDPRLTRRSGHLMCSCIAGRAAELLETTIGDAL